MRAGVLQGRSLFNISGAPRSGSAFFLDDQGLSRSNLTGNIRTGLHCGVSLVFNKYRRLRRDLTRGGIAGLPSTVARMAGWAWHYRAHRQWLRTIQGKTTRAIVLVYPRIVYRPTTTYLYSGASRRHRLDMLVAHYEFMNETYSSGSFDAMIGPGGLQLWSFVDADYTFSIAIEGPCRKHREGELSLAFTMDGVALCHISFSVIPAGLIVDDAAPPCRLMIYVGRVQGTARHFDEIRTATIACQACTPRDLLMNALFGLADAWKIRHVGGVSAQRQLSTGDVRGEGHVFDYDRWWESYEAEHLPSGHYLIDLAQRDMRPSRRAVSKTRQKKRFKRSLRTAVAEAAVPGPALSTRVGLAAPPPQDGPTGPNS